MFTMSSSHLLKQYVEYTPPLPFLLKEWTRAGYQTLFGGKFRFQRWSRLVEQYVEYTYSVWRTSKWWFILKHFALNFQFGRWAHEEDWHFESFWICCFPPPQQNNTIEQIKKKNILNHVWKLRPPDPIQQYVRNIKKIGILSHLVDFVAVLLKTLRSTYEPTSWHHESCLQCLPHTF